MKFSLSTLFCVFILLFSNALYAQEQQAPKVSLKDILDKESHETETSEKNVSSFDYDVPEDKYSRGQPRASFEGFMLAAKDQDFDRAIEFIDFRKVKKDLSQGSFDNIDEEIRNKMNEFMETAKKAFL